MPIIGSGPLGLGGHRLGQTRVVAGAGRPPAGGLWRNSAHGNWLNGQSALGILLEKCLCDQICPLLRTS